MDPNGNAIPAKMAINLQNDTQPQAYSKNGTRSEFKQAGLQGLPEVRQAAQDSAAAPAWGGPGALPSARGPSPGPSPKPGPGPWGESAFRSVGAAGAGSGGGGGGGAGGLPGFQLALESLTSVDANLRQLPAQGRGGGGGAAAPRIRPLLAEQLVRRAREAQQRLHSSEGDGGGGGRPPALSSLSPTLSPTSSGGTRSPGPFWGGGGGRDEHGGGGAAARPQWSPLTARGGGGGGGGASTGGVPRAARARHHTGTWDRRPRNDQSVPKLEKTTRSASNLNNSTMRLSSPSAEDGQAFSSQQNSRPKLNRSYSELSMLNRKTNNETSLPRTARSRTNTSDSEAGAREYLPTLGTGLSPRAVSAGSLGGLGGAAAAAGGRRRLRPLPRSGSGFSASSIDDDEDYDDIKPINTSFQQLKKIREVSERSEKAGGKLDDEDMDEFRKKPRPKIVFQKAPAHRPVPPPTLAAAAPISSRPDSPDSPRPSEPPPLAAAAAAAEERKGKVLGGTLGGPKAVGGGAKGKGKGAPPPSGGGLQKDLAKMDGLAGAAAAGDQHRAASPDLLGMMPESLRELGALKSFDEEEDEEWCDLPRYQKSPTKSGEKLHLLSSFDPSRADDKLSSGERDDEAAATALVSLRIKVNRKYVWAYLQEGQTALEAAYTFTIKHGLQNDKYYTEYITSLTKSFEQKLEAILAERQIIRQHINMMKRNELQQQQEKEKKQNIFEVRIKMGGKVYWVRFPAGAPPDEVAAAFLRQHGLQDHPNQNVYSQAIATYIQQASAVAL